MADRILAKVGAQVITEKDVDEFIMALGQRGAGYNTPGANANGVKELALCALFLAARNVVGGIEWAKGLTGDDVAKQVEKGKSAFGGTELKGKTLIPSHQFYSAYGELFKNRCELSRDAARLSAYLCGEEIDADEGAKNGFTVLLYRGAVIGGGKTSGGRIKNHYPKGLRN